MPDLASPAIADPPLWCSTHLRFPYSCTATLDGLLPNPWVAAAISDPSPSSPPDAASLVPDDDDGNVLALAEFVPYCNTHYLLPLDVLISDFPSIPEVLVAAMDGILDLELDVEDDPLWSEAVTAASMWL
jgi:hypothetical protein